MAFRIVTRTVLSTTAILTRGRPVLEKVIVNPQACIRLIETLYSNGTI